MIQGVDTLLKFIGTTLIILLTTGLAASAQKLDITLDWLPSPEYYGFYYADRAGLYQREGLQVTIRNASGAPVVAAQLGAGAINVGTTTSDNVLRQAALGARFSHLVPLMLFNPVSIVSLPKKPVNKVSDLRPLTIGTNPQTSPYAQYEYLLRRNSIPLGQIKEYPIGYGGAAQLLGGEVDAFLAYTTNQAIDVELKSPTAIELHFEENGLRTYGLVLCVTASAAGISDEVASRFIRATIEGYKQGGAKLDETADMLVKAEPSLSRDKVKLAIRKMVLQNSRASPQVPSDLDGWVILPNPADGVRAELSKLYQNGLLKWQIN